MIRQWWERICYALVIVFAALQCASNRPRANDALDVVMVLGALYAGWRIVRTFASNYPSKIDDD